MRFLDLASAALVGVISVSLVAYMDPVPFSGASRRYAEEAALTGLLLRAVASEGLPWIRTASSQEICSAFRGFSNATVTVSAAVAGTSCGGPPPAGAVSSTLTLPFASRKVTIVAWMGAGR